MFLNIDYGLCQGCGGCAEAFPQFFEMRDDKAWVIKQAWTAAFPAERFNHTHKGERVITRPYAFQWAARTGEAQENWHEYRQNEEAGN